MRAVRTIDLANRSVPLALSLLLSRRFSSTRIAPQQFRSTPRGPLAAFGRGPRSQLARVRTSHAFGGCSSSRSVRMINMKTLSSSRAPSPSYEPLASSSYIDFEGEDDRDAPLLQSSRSSGDGRRGAGQAGRWNVMLLLGFALLLLIGLTWSSGAAYDWQAGRGTVELSTAVVVEDGADGGSIAKEQIEGEEQARTDEEEPLEPPKTADPTIATDQEQEELDAVLAGQDGVEDDGVEDDAGVLDDLDDDSSTALDSTEDDTDAESSPSPLIPILNVRPHPRPPPSDPAVADQIRYLSYENHSGFHNRQSSAGPLASLIR